VNYHVRPSKGEAGDLEKKAGVEAPADVHKLEQVNKIAVRRQTLKP
jgi:hypothetical protein